MVQKLASSGAGPRQPKNVGVDVGVPAPFVNLSLEETRNYIVLAAADSELTRAI